MSNTRCHPIKHEMSIARIKIRVDSQRQYRSDDFRAPRKQIVWAPRPGQGVTATTSFWRAPGGPLQPRGPPRGGSLDNCFSLNIGAWMSRMYLRVKENWSASRMYWKLALPLCVERGSENVTFEFVNINGIVSNMTRANEFQMRWNLLRFACEMPEYSEYSSQVRWRQVHEFARASCIVAADYKIYDKFDGCKFGVTYFLAKMIR